MKKYILILFCSTVVLGGCRSSISLQKNSNDTLIVHLYPAFISYSTISIIRNTDSSMIDMKLYSNDGYKMRNIYSKNTRLENGKTDSLWQILKNYKFPKIENSNIGVDGMTVHGEFKNGVSRKFSFWSASDDSSYSILNQVYILIGDSFKDKAILKYLRI